MIADPTLLRMAPKVWLGGSPLRLFRLTERGDRLLNALVESGIWVPVGESELALADRLSEAGGVHPAPWRADAHGRDVHDRDVHGRDVHGREVTVVIPVRDDIPGLAALLGDLSVSTSDAERRKIVVVDDGSRDPAGVTALVAANRATLVRHERSRGPAAARNSGLEVVDTPLVAFVDADIRAPVGWLEPLLAHLADPRVVAVAPRVRNAAGHGILARYDQDRGPLDMGAGPALVRPRSRVGYVPSAALVVRTAKARALGGFDEQLRFGEDVDFVWRLGETGGAVRYEPAAEVTHRPRSSISEWLRQRIDYGSSAAELNRRHPGAVAPLVVSPWSAAVWAAIALGHPVLGVGMAAGSAVALARKLTALEPRRAAVLALRGHLGAGEQIARALVRPWWPLTLGAAMVSRRARRVMAAAVVIHLVTTPGRPHVRVLALVDDMAYSVGVSKGVLRAGNPGALMPAFPRWP
jgi:mycofactocin system glycosyltransferase